MGYHIGKYRAADGTEYNLINLDAEENKLFRELMAAQDAVKSWEEFQEKTAKPVVQMAQKKSRRNDGTYHFQWEKYFLYQIRFDMLRNVGIRTGELPGELSDMIIQEEKA